MASDIALTNAMRSLTNAMSKFAGISGQSDIPKAASAFGTGPSNEYEFGRGGELKNLNDISDTFERSSRDFKKSTDDFVQHTASLGMKMAPFADAVSQFMKWTVFRPAELMGGGEGRAVRAGLERATGAGNIAFDVAAAVAAATGNLGVAAGIQLMGRAGLATKAGQMFYGEENLAQRGFQQNVLEDFGRKKMDTETAAMFNVRSGRLGVQAGAWGGGNVPGLISGLAGDLNENPQVLQQAIANAFQIGGSAGIKNISRDNISKLVREGYGDAATMMAIQATAGRYGYGQGAVPDLANRTGLAPSEMLPLMQQTRMQYYMFKAGSAESINKFVANTSMGAINPSMALGAMSSTAQGAAGVTDEAASMLQYRSFLEANPGSTYLDFVEAKRNGFADERWRKFVGGAARTYGSGGQAMRIAGGTVLGGAAPGSLEGIAGQYAQGMGPDVYRTGKRTPSGYEETAQQLGMMGVTALDLSLAGSQKVLKDLAGYINDFVVDISKAADAITAKGQAVAEHAATSRAAPGLGGENVFSGSWGYENFWNEIKGMFRPANN
jgi:hypothetical protein